MEMSTSLTPLCNSSRMQEDTHKSTTAQRGALQDLEMVYMHIIGVMSWQKINDRTIIPC